MANATDKKTVICRVKWFDPKKGFGFITEEGGGPDILLHTNVLRATGRSTITDGAVVEAIVVQIDGRWQATSIVTIKAEVGQDGPKLPQVTAIDPGVLRALPYQPARVKWYNSDKGIGFANVFGSANDVFIHAEVLRASGLASLEAGEAVALRSIKGERGWLAVEIADWFRHTA